MVIVDVIATVIVAVHVNGNATLIVIRPVDGDHATAAAKDMLTSSIKPAEQGEVLPSRQRLGDGVGRTPST
ncbi:MAG: hypothetical protein AB7T06_01335 [Kofleriaceae bacterium]